MTDYEIYPDLTARPMTERARTRGGGRIGETGSLIAFHDHVQLAEFVEAEEKEGYTFECKERRPLPTGGQKHLSGVE